MTRQPWVDPDAIFLHAIAQAMKFGITPWSIRESMQRLAMEVDPPPEEDVPSGTALRVVYPPETQMLLSFDVAGPTASAFEPDPDPDRTKAMLAAGWRSWEKNSA